MDFRYYFSDKWFYIPQDKVIAGKLPIPFQLQEKVSELIIKDAEGKKFSLKRVGEWDEFKEDFAQNYIYLLWLKGNQPISEASLIYTIYEDTQKLPTDFKGEMYWVSNIAIVKEQ